MLLSDSGSSADWNMAAASKPALVRNISALADRTAPSPVADRISSDRVIGIPANKMHFLNIDFISQNLIYRMSDSFLNSSFRSALWFLRYSM
jgi:hypothetical protein